MSANFSSAALVGSMNDGRLSPLKTTTSLAWSQVARNEHRLHLEFSQLTTCWIRAYEPSDTKASPRTTGSIMNTADPSGLSRSENSKPLALRCHTQSRPDSKRLHCTEIALRRHVAEANAIAPVDAGAACRLVIQLDLPELDLNSRQAPTTNRDRGCWRVKSRWAHGIGSSDAEMNAFERRRKMVALRGEIRPDFLVVRPS